MVGNYTLFTLYFIDNQLCLGPEKFHRGGHRGTGVARGGGPNQPTNFASEGAPGAPNQPTPGGRAGKTPRRMEPTRSVQSSSRLVRAFFRPSAAAPLPLGRAGLPAHLEATPPCLRPKKSPHFALAEKGGWDPDQPADRLGYCECAYEANGAAFWSVTGHDAS